MTTITPLQTTPSTALFIDGRWRDAADDRRLEVFDPATEERIASVASASVVDGCDAVDAAAAAGPAWAATPPRARAEILRRCYDTMLAHRAELEDLIVREGGKSRGDARAEVTYAAEFFRWFSEEAARATGKVRTAPGGDKRIMTVLEPIGVAILVTPWNFPAAMATRKIAPALAAGCTVVLKPAPETPLTALLLAELLTDAGVPPGVVNVVPTADAPEVVEAMMAHPATRMVSFTGSTTVGRILLRQAADAVLRCSMELGGNAPFVVFADADLDAAVEGAMIAKLRNAGQSCIAANRFLVEAPIADAFAERLAARMAEVRVGPGSDPDNDLGPMIHAQACARIAGLVDAARAAGATVHTGGGPRDGLGSFFEPTVLSGLAPDAAILHEEIFGPVAPIVAFETEDEALAAANDTPFGLAAYVYAGDLERAMRVASGIDAGMVGINRGLLSDPAAPFGGVKHSGLGREGGHDGLLEFLETKYVALDW
ncbi:MAG: NAD-dependent succinate-semialdehyde dehydrogenase [Nitriliruptoraceae bacterium]|nr:NAD-dependent succinate-semialdehyde dehydrogenase [Nitriliruptoraceae bacterium]